MDIFIQVSKRSRMISAMLAGRQARGGCHHSLDGLPNLLAGALLDTRKKCRPGDPLEARRSSGAK